MARVVGLTEVSLNREALLPTPNGMIGTWILPITSASSSDSQSC